MFAMQVLDCSLKNQMHLPNYISHIQYELTSNHVILHVSVYRIVDLFILFA